jgi:hypothetical protein
MMTSLYVLEVMCFVKKYEGNFEHNFSIHEHNTRSKYDLHTQICNTFLLYKSVINMGFKLYKHLPSKIKKLKHFNCFRKEIKLVLLKTRFTHLKSFISPSQCGNAVKYCL